MTRLKDIKNISNWLSDSPLAKSHLWGKDVELITPVDILTFIKSCDMDCEDSVAVMRCVDVMLIELRRMIAAGHIESLQIEKLEIIEQRLMLSDLREMLSRIDPSFARVISFALLAEMELIDVERLLWSDVRELECSDEMTAALKGLPQNIRSPYVFWEYTAGVAGPIMGSELGVLEATGGSFSWLQRHYKRMVWIDYAGDSEIILGACEQAWGVGE